eukprot:g2546.t1
MRLEPIAFSGHKFPVCFITVSHNQNWVVSVDEGNENDLPEIRTWSLLSGKCLCRHTGHLSAIRCAAISENGERFVTGSSDTTLRVWRGHGNDKNLKPVKTNEAKKDTMLVLKGHLAPIEKVFISPNGSRIISGCRNFEKDQTIRIWDVEKGTCIHIFHTHILGGVWNDIAVSQDWLWLAVANSGVISIRVWVASGPHIGGEVASAGGVSVTIKKDLHYFNCKTIFTNLYLQ